MIILAICVLVACACHGVIQGMTMIKPRDKRAAPDSEPGVRCHQWFRGFHWLLVALFSLIAVISQLAGNLLDHWFGFLGLALIGQRVVEVAYSFTRFGKFIPESENFFGLGIRISGDRAFSFHIWFTVIGIVLIGMGGGW